MGRTVWKIRVVSVVHCFAQTEDPVGKSYSAEQTHFAHFDGTWYWGGSVLKDVTQI